MQVKEIYINTKKNQGYGICNKKVQNLIVRWSYHSDLLYISFVFLLLMHSCVYSYLINWEQLAANRLNSVLR